jgi:hypothetical protein
MKVIRFSQRNLQNEEFFEFYTEFKDRVARFKEDEIGIKSLLVKFTPLYSKADELLEIFRKSSYTKKMETIDKKRDELFRGLSGVVRSSLKQPDAAKQSAAERLNILLDGYKNSILSGSHVKESAAIYNLLQDLRGDTYKADVALLALTDWVAAIDKAEKEFLAFKAERAEETIVKPKEDLLQVRSKMDTLYNAMADVLDARLLADDLGGDVVIDWKDLDDGDREEGETPKYETRGNVTYNFVFSWNEVVKKYRNLLLQRAGRRAKNKETDEPES